MHNLAILNGAVQGNYPIRIFRGGTVCAALVWHILPGNSLASLGHFSIGQICYGAAAGTAFLKRRR
jgi:hypothetical protein